jgi:hypothetical protein
MILIKSIITYFGPRNLYPATSGYHRRNWRNMKGKARVTEKVVNPEK